MNKEGDEVYCEIINKDLRVGNKDCMQYHKTQEVFVLTKVRKENLSNKGQKVYPLSQVLGMSSVNPLNWSQPVA